MSISATVLTLALSVTFGGAAYALNVYDPIGSYKYPASQGESYLRQQGYTNIQGGWRDYNAPACHRHHLARRYDVQKDGVPQRGIVVCFSKTFGEYVPNQG